MCWPQSGYVSWIYFYNLRHMSVICWVQAENFLNKHTATSGSRSVVGKSAMSRLNGDYCKERMWEIKMVCPCCENYHEQAHHFVLICEYAMFELKERKIKTLTRWLVYIKNLCFISHQRLKSHILFLLA